MFAWGEFVEEAALTRIDDWLRAGGTVVFPWFLNMALRTVDDDTAIFRRWQRGDTGAGRFFRYRGDDEPPSLYAAYVRSVLTELAGLSPITRAALEMERPGQVFVSAQEDGHFLILNFGDEPAVVSHASIGSVEIAPYTIERVAFETG